MTNIVIEQLVAFGNYADSAAPAVTLREVEDRAAAPPASPVSARSRTPGWVVAATVAALVLVVVGGLSVVFGGSEGSAPPVNEATTVAPPNTITNHDEQPGTHRETVWMSSVEGVLLTATPPLLPPVPGTYGVTVNGYRSGKQNGVWLTTCPGASGVVDPSTWSGAQGDVVALCQLGDDPILATGDFQDGEFQTTLQVVITDETIRHGGVVISAGDIWVPVAGNVLVRVSDDPRTPWEQSYDLLNIGRLTRLISYWPPFVENFNTTYESHDDCDEAYNGAVTAQANLLEDLEKWDDTTKDKPGFAYDTAAAELIASERWLTDHICPGRHDFVGVG